MHVHTFVLSNKIPVQNLFFVLLGKVSFKELNVFYHNERQRRDHTQAAKRLTFVTG